MIFLQLMLTEFKQQWRSMTFYMFIAVVLLFYFTQYDTGANRLLPPSPDKDYGITTAVTEEDKLVLGYQQMYGVWLDKKVSKYTPLYKSIKLSTDELAQLESFLKQMAPGAGPSDVVTITAQDFQIDYHTMIEFMDHFDRELGGNTTFGVENRQFVRHMTYEEALADYERLKSEDHFTDAYARYFSDYMGILASLFVVFLSAFSLLRDKRFGTQDLIYSSNMKGIVYIGAKCVGLFLSVMSVFLMVGLLETIVFVLQSVDYHISIYPLAFFTHLILWVSPTVLLSIALPMMISVAVQNSMVPIVLQIGLALYSMNRTELVGDYDWTHIMIRFNIIGHRDLYEKFLVDIILNRLFYTLFSILLILLTAWLWSNRRNHSFRRLTHGNPAQAGQ